MLEPRSGRLSKNTHPQPCLHKDWLQAEMQIEAEEEAIDEASRQSFPASDPPERWLLEN